MQQKYCIYFEIFVDKSPIIRQRLSLLSERVWNFGECVVFFSLELKV